MAPCTQGEVTRVASDTFGLDFFVVDDGPAVRSIVLPLMAKDVSWGRQLLDATNRGAVPSLSDSTSLIVHILGVNPNNFPSFVQYLVGTSICQGLISVTQLADSSIAMSVQIRGGNYLGRAGLIVPRSVLQEASRPQVCVEPKFQFAYPKVAIEESYRGRTDIYCGKVGVLPGKTGLNDSLQQGEAHRIFYLVRKAN